MARIGFAILNTEMVDGILINLACHPELN